MEEKKAEWISKTTEKLKEKVAWVSTRSQNKIPYTTVNKVHDDKSIPSASQDDGLNWWCNGFFGGMMSLMYHETKEERYINIVRGIEEKLDTCFSNFYGLHHDVGFMWLPTAVADYRLTGNLVSKTRGLHAASLLAGRFNPVGNFIRAWNDPKPKDSSNKGWAIIDCLLNIPLLYWASEETNDPRFRQIAMLHADTARKYFVRPDGSVRHIVEFNPETGEMIKDYAGQGYALGSSWTRGQAWGLYGFVMSYIHTKKQEYLDTAKQIAHYFISNIPEDGLILADFRQPKEPVWYDDSAAAIAASGLLELSKQCNSVDAEIYEIAALKLLIALDQNHCDYTKDNDGIVQNCSVAYYGEHEINLIYADYFFLEAILKLKVTDFFLW